MQARILVTAGLIAASLCGSARAQVRAFPDPTGYWSFDACDASTTWDHAVAPNHATLSGGVQCAAGQYGTAAHFDGTGAIEVPGSSSFHPAQFTVAAWVKPDSELWGAVVNKWYAMDSWGLWFDGASYVFAVSFPDGSWGTPVGISAPANPGEWTHVAGVYDGSDLVLYLNGSEAARAHGNGAAQTSDRPIAIGNHPDWDGFVGAIDEVRFYNQALAGADIALLATPPSPLGNRGLHLYPDKLACGEDTGQFPCQTGVQQHDKFRHDLDVIHSIANLNSIKTTMFSYIGDDFQDYKRNLQDRKLSYLASATGGSKTWLVRVWPTMNDCPSPVADYEACGRTFAQALLPALTHLRDLHLPYVYLEVANEPNIPHVLGEDSMDFVGGDPANRNEVPTMDHYNDFFRGFYFGQQSVGHNFPLVYAGLSPCCDANGGGALNWYHYFWVRKHIADYAAKIGVHLYWQSTSSDDPNSRQGPAGLLYRAVHDILADTSPNVYPVPARGIQVTEFNFNRVDIGDVPPGFGLAVQSYEDCEWWKTAGDDATRGYWIEQTLRYITTNDDAQIQERGWYWLDDSQVGVIRDCRPGYTAPL